MEVKYRNLQITSQRERQIYINGLKQIMSSGMMMMGKKSEEFESKFSKYCGKKYAVGVASGTSGLVLALKSLGIGKGDEVITTTMSWLATSNALLLCGAKPIYVDIGDDLNINSDLVERSITKKTKAIIAVHFCGRICDIDKLKKISKKHQIKLIEDASQAAGSEYLNRRAGFWSDLAAFSMNPMKPLGAFGEAGAVVLNSRKLKKKIESLRYLGTKNIEICVDPDVNHKIDEIQSIWLLSRLSNLNKSLEKRRRKASLIHERLNDEVRVIGIEEPKRTTFFEFTLECESRDELQKFLTKNKIETKIKHPILMCDQPGYNLKEKYKVKNSRRLLKKILSLPLHESLSINQIDYMTKKINDFYGR